MITDMSEVMWPVKVYRRPFVAVVEYRLLYSLASIEGYTEVLVVYRCAFRGNVVRLEGYCLA
jgi:hypothetical protein